MLLLRPINHLVVASTRAHAVYPARVVPPTGVDTTSIFHTLAVNARREQLPPCSERCIHTTPQSYYVKAAPLRFVPPPSLRSNCRYIEGSRASHGFAFFDGSVPTLQYWHTIRQQPIVTCARDPMPDKRRSSFWLCWS
jgi:hypothetical protein